MHKKTRQSEMANTSPRPMPVPDNVHPIKIEKYQVSILLIDTATQEVPWKTFERNCQSNFWDMPLNCYMLNVAHVTNDAKWRPIITTFGTLIENMSRTGLYYCHIFSDLFDDFMSNINCGIEFYMLNVKYCSLKLLLFHLIGHTKSCLQKNIENFLWLGFCDMTVPSKSKVPSLWPWPLTYEGKNTKILAGHTHRQTYRQTDTHTDRQTGWKQYLATPSGGEVIIRILTRSDHCIDNFPSWTYLKCMFILYLYMYTRSSTTSFQMLG